VSGNLEIPIIWHLKRVIPRTKVWLFIRKKSVFNETGMFKRTHSSVCKSTVVAIS
jgi:hypothetical protein